MVVAKKTAIRDYGGKILGFIEEDNNGNRQCRAFNGQILGYYDARQDVTREFNGRIVSRGDTVSGFIHKLK